MFRTFHILFTEQTTADEVVVFLLVSVVAALLLAFTLYSAILALLWRGRLRGVTTLTALLFPRRRQAARYLGEYLLAASTSALLTLTIAARHDAVQYVLDYPLHRLEAADVASAFPFGGVTPDEMTAQAGRPDAYVTSLHSLASGLQAERAGMLPSIGIEALLLPAVNASGADQAGLWLRAVLDRLEADPWRRFPDQRHLLAFAVVLLLAYVGWFAYLRTRTVQQSPEGADTDYLRLLGRLLVPAVCTALLLLSAAGAADPQRITRSAVASAGLGIGPDAAEAARHFQAAMDRQLTRGQLVRHVLAGDDSVPGPLIAIDRLDTGLEGLGMRTSELAVRVAEDRLRIEALRDDISRLETRLTADSIREELAHRQLGERADAVDARMAEVADRIASLSGEAVAAQTAAREAAAGVARLEARVGSVEGSIDGLRDGIRQLAGRIPSTGLLLVVTSPPVTYQIRVGGSQGTLRASGAGVGLHALAPGDYTIVSPFGAANQRLGEGAAATVRLERTIAAAPSLSTAPLATAPTPGPATAEPAGVSGRRIDAP